MLIRCLAGPDDSDDTEISNPEWWQIETAIRKLDGARCTCLSLSIGVPVPHMTIGGGTGGRYIVYCTRDNLTFSTLLAPDALPGRMQIKACGQVSDYDRRVCVGIDAALRAARHYAETGECTPNLQWETK